MSKENDKQAEKETGVKPLAFAYSITLGCDPEFFFTSDGKVIGSEKVLPKDGLEEDYNGWDDEGGGKFIIDGVQAELNPRPETCRALLANGIHRCFADLYRKLKNDGKSVDVSFAPVVDISQAELDSLSEKSKVFGCAPSRNVNFDTKKAKIKVNPKKYLKRSAGGHIHLGEGDEGLETIYYCDEESGDEKDIQVRNMLDQVLHNPRVLVPLLDLVVANTCVLIDRDSSNVERRKNYGRVGEYRLKEYGLEYRTLSNFWLRSYQLMSFVMGLSRMTCHLVQQSRNGTPYITKLMEAVPRKDVIKAVQENDFDLAYRNFRKIEAILVAAGADDDYNYPISRCFIKEFHHFVKKGVDYWFKDDVFQHWVHLPDGHDKGWESFCRNWVRKDMNGTKVMKTKKVLTAQPIQNRRQPARVAAE